ncbi:ATP-binding protein [Pyrobaculum aerophilum]|uniref:AAA family ATPase n=1 Tax=Pyrobaculum aerophilum TaxID=13773 RepID=A0A371QU02_9CREN|nr:DUF87 domain-containing protein [Pyrobaculum aerophilum]RFA92341.1 AAA family ATPase [Pyrobaculum aerophilum]RFA99009.1 AAA family ATPase [Pyrobaculum aerophilum]
MLELALLLLLLAFTFNDGVFIGIGKTGPVEIPLDRHIVITGPTRSGKTKLAKKIVARSGLPALVLDWHGEYEGLSIDARKIKIDIEKFDKKLLVEILGLSLNLNEPSIYFLYRAIRNQKLRDIKDVVAALEDFLVATRSEVEMKAAIARRLEYVMDVFEKGIIPVEKIFKYKKTIIINLSKLKLYEEKILISLFILSSLYNYLFEKGPSKKVDRLLVVDEAQNILKRGDVVKYLVFESAKYGLRLVLVSNEMPPEDILVHATLVLTRPHYAYSLKTKRAAVIRDNTVKELWII